MEGNYTISAFSENSSGILHRITVLFTRRKMNIESLTVSETEKKGISRFTIVVKEHKDRVVQVAKQIRRIIEVTDVYVSENRELLFTEVAYFKIHCENIPVRLKMEELAHRYGAHLVHGDSDFLVFEKTGREDEINALFLLLEPFGMLEFIRSGRIAVRKEPPEELL